MDLQSFNPWWKTGNVSTEFIGRKRKIFDEIVTYVDKRQIVLFTGLRRVGKTTLMYQIIDGLLRKDVKPYNIMYFSFDEMRYDLEEIFVNSLDAKFFLKTPQKEEIDIIHAHDKVVLPVEIKIKERIRRDDVKTIFKFLERNKLKKALLVTLDTETKFEKESLLIEAIPYWKHWSIRARIS